MSPRYRVSNARMWRRRACSAAASSVSWAAAQYRTKKVTTSVMTSSRQNRTSTIGTSTTTSCSYQIHRWPWTIKSRRGKSQVILTGYLMHQGWVTISISIWSTGLRKTCWQSHWSRLSTCGMPPRSQCRSCATSATTTKSLRWAGPTKEVIWAWEPKWAKCRYGTLIRRRRCGRLMATLPASALWPGTIWTRLSLHRAARTGPYWFGTCGHRQWVTWSWQTIVKKSADSAGACTTRTSWLRAATTISFLYGRRIARSRWQSSQSTRQPSRP